MKNPIKRMGLMLAAALVMAACATARAQQTAYFTGDGGKDIRLAVLEPAGKGLSEDDKWMLSLVQSSIYTDFNKYSGMTLIDKQNIEKVLEEWEQSMSGNYSDADRVKIGNLTNASHILSGTVIKTPNAFMLELSVTDIQSGERKASYSHPTSTAAIENHSAIKEASAELLKQLGVNLTSTALGELKQATNIARIQAEEALARGIVAKRQGTEVAALSYFFQAAILDPSLAEAVNRSSVMAANVSSGNIGEDARNDVAWRKSWVKRLEEAEQYIDHLNKTVSMPYTLFYSDEIIRGDINYQKETMPITIKTNLYGNGSIKVWAQSVEKALGAVYDGLVATGRKDVWNLRWPYNNVTNLRAFREQKKKFTIVAELVNSQNNVIGKREFEVSGKWGYNTYERPAVWVNSDTREDVTFRDVNVNDITDNLTIRFASVNGEDAVTAAGKGVLQIKAMPKSEFDYDDQFTFAFGEIKKYKGTYKDIFIPNTIWDNPVISIGIEAFRSKSLTGVTIPDGVTYIGRQAFVYNNFTRITIGENVTLDENAFGNGFEEAYKNSGRRAGRYTWASDNWSRILTDEEQEEQRQRQEAERRRYEAGRPQLEREEAERQLQEIEAERQRKERVRQVAVNEKEAKKEAEANRTGFKSFYWGGGVLLMMHQWNSLLYMPPLSWLNGQGNGGFTFAFGGADIFHIGMHFDIGPWYNSINPKDAERIRDDVEKNHPGIPRDDIKILASGSNKVSFTARLYLMDRDAPSVYLSGGAGWWWHNVHVQEKSDWGLEQIPLVSFKAAPVYAGGIGIMMTQYGGLFLETHYNILPRNGYFDGYLTINVGMSYGGRKRWSTL